MTALRVQADQQPSYEEWRRLLDSVARLEAHCQEIQARLDQYEASRPLDLTSAVPTRAVESAYQSSSVSRLVQDDPPAAFGAVSEPDAIDAKITKILSRYQDVISDVELRHAFEAEFDVRSFRATTSESNEFAAETTDSPMIWAIQVGDSWMLLPGYSPIKRWYNFRRSNGNTAQEQLGGAYDLHRGEGDLRIIAPAWASGSDQRLVVTERGVLAGVP